MYSLIALDTEMKYSPDSRLLYVHVELEKHESDAWLVFSLSEGEISACGVHVDERGLPSAMS